MTIIKRNRLRARLVDRLAVRAGQEAYKFQREVCGNDECVCSNCAFHAYKTAVYQERSWLIQRNIGIPELQRMQGN